MHWLLIGGDAEIVTVRTELDLGTKHCINQEKEELKALLLSTDH